MHGGSGGKSDYWDGFDKAVMRHLNDNKTLYLDGSKTTNRGGGFFNLGNNRIASKRISEGYRYGKRNADNIIRDLRKGEKVKIITHSMGGAYGKGFVQALVDYCKRLGIDPLSIIEFEADFAPFQPEEQEAVDGIPTYQFSHSKDILARNTPMTGAEQKDTTSDSNQGHSIASFVNQVNALPSGTYKYENGMFIPQ